MNPILRNVKNLLAVLLVAGLLGGCDQGPEPEKVSLREVEPSMAVPEKPVERELRVAVAAMISPKETYIHYQNLLELVGKKMGLPVRLVQRETYAEVNELLEKQELDLAFVCTGAYVDGHDQFGMELLAAPEAYGRTVYYSYIIVPADSGATDFADLRGKRFAFTDPMSNTGKLAPTYMLAQMNESIDDFFSEYTFTYSHDNSIKAVARKQVDGAAVDSLVWDYLDANDPQFTAQTKIIKKSPPYGIPPLVVPPGLDPELKKRVQKILLTIHEEDEGRAILKKMMINRFVVVNDAIYDSVRAMRQWEKKK